MKASLYVILAACLANTVGCTVTWGPDRGATFSPVGALEYHFPASLAVKTNGAVILPPETRTDAP